MSQHASPTVSLAVVLLGLACAPASAATINVPANQPTIQAAIDAAVSGVDTVLVANGVYTGAGNKELDFNGKSITVRSANGASSCTIDLQMSGRAFDFVDGETTAAVVDGFTIINGQQQFGGGIRTISSSPTIRRCIFRSNDASSSGGGIYVTVAGADPFIDRCVFDDNRSQNGGGIGVAGGSAPTIVNCLFVDNTATNVGGGLSNNHLTNMANCTFVDNTATNNGGGIYNGTQVPLYSSLVLRGNAPNQIGGTILPTVRDSNIQGGFAGFGNISTDPLFVNPTAGDYRLGAFSPCVDNGNNAGVPAGVTVDLDGNRRFVNDPGVVDGGVGAPPLVDMGAYERQDVSVTGACCLLDGTCISTGPDSCVALCGVYQGDGTSCTAPCTPVGSVLDHQKISATDGGFTGPLGSASLFGQDVEGLGDLDGDGVRDVAVGAVGDQFEDFGAVWILFLNDDGTVKDEQKINGSEGGFGGNLEIENGFGNAIARLGDLDGDGVTELAVGAPSTDLGGSSRGAVWILFLNADGTVKDETLIGSGTGGFGGVLTDGNRFGDGVTALGDLDGDGVRDVAVGTPQDNTGAQHQGAIWILFLNADGTVKSEQKIADGVGGFTGDLDLFDAFGQTLATLGDLDGNGTTEIAAGSPSDDDGGVGVNVNRGAVWILFMNPDGTVLTQQKISDTQGGFTGVLADIDALGVSLGEVGDLNGDGIGELAVGTLDDDGGVGVNANHGAVWILFLRADGTVKGQTKISDTQGGFTGVLADGDNFGVGVAGLGDIDGDGIVDLAAGARNDDDGGSFNGAVWVLFLDGVPICVGDFDGNGNIGFGDLTQILNNWGPCPPGCPWDLDESGDVGFSDLTTVLNNWGTTC